MGKIINLAISALFFAQFAWADGFLIDEREAYGRDIFDNYSIGIEIEFSGLNDAKILDIVTQHFPFSTISGSIETGLFVNTQLGNIRFYVEGQAWRYAGRDEEKYQAQVVEDLLKAPRELAFPPIRYSDLMTLHTLFNDLKFHGAQGTTETSAVSMQVNIEMPRLVNHHAVDRLLNLLRVYYSPLNRIQARNVIQVPKIRRPYVGDYSPGFMQRLMNPNYSPTPRQLFDDFMYRQSLELLKYPDAWTAPIEVLRPRLIALGIDAVVPAVVKMNKIRISSLLMDAFPDDPLSILAVKYNWAKPIPIIEFREFNNDFDVYPKVEMAIGVIEASRIHGNYMRGLLFSKLIQIPVFTSCNALILN